MSFKSDNLYELRHNARVYILGLYLGKHLLFRLQKMPNIYRIMKRIFFNWTILRSCNHPENQCRNIFECICYNGATAAFLLTTHSIY